MKDTKVEQARIRIDAARKHLTEALEAVSGPEPDWTRCEAGLVDRIVDECCDTIQACVNLAAAYGVRDQTKAMRDCEDRNRERGRL